MSRIIVIIYIISPNYKLLLDMVICVEILDFMVMVLQEPDMKKKTESTMCFFNSVQLIKYYILV